MVKTMKKANVAGFSLVELMVVVAIIGILAAVAIPNFQRFQRKARASEGHAVLGNIKSSMEGFHAEWDTYTSDLQSSGMRLSGQLNTRFTLTGAFDAVAAGFYPGAGVSVLTPARFTNDILVGLPGQSFAMGSRSGFGAANNCTRPVPGVAMARHTYGASTCSDLGAATGVAAGMHTLQTAHNLPINIVQDGIQ